MTHATKEQSWESHALRSILEGTANDTGEPFFRSLVRNLSSALSVRHAWVTEFLADDTRVRALAFWSDGAFREDVEYSLMGTPCEGVVLGSALVHQTRGVQQRYPEDPILVELQAESYLGVPLIDVDQKVLGHLAVIDDESMPSEPQGLGIFHIFATRATAELQRSRALKEKERALGESEALVDALMDNAPMEITIKDPDGQYVRVNPTSERLFGTREIVGKTPSSHLPEPYAACFEAHDRAVSETRCASQRECLVPGEEGDLTLRMTKFPIFDAEGELRAVGSIGVDITDLKHAEVALRESLSEVAALKNRLQEENVYLQEEIKLNHNFEEILGRSNKLKTVLKSVERVATTDATVLVLGETGTGKELIARAVHNLSPRKARPLVKVNCAALPESLVESELFGHEKGAFTGALARKIGRFELADGGTMFLDEIGDLPLSLQAKLLRVLQEGEFERLGNSTPLSVDVRLITATNRDLQQMVQEKTFREDLYYRLNVFPLTLPPLRERRDDIPLLVQRFVEKYARKTGKTVETIPKKVMDALIGYSWPGNVRELENIIERAVILAQGGTLGVDEAFELPRSQPAHDATSLEEVERQHFMRVLEDTNWVISGQRGAAQVLGVNPSTLRSRMKKLGLHRQTS